MEKIGLVLEGGGVRGAYTAGALKWLTDNGITFDYQVGISTGGAYLAIHLSGRDDIAEKMSTDYAVNSDNVGLRAVFHEGHYVAGNTIFRHWLKDILGYRVQELRNSQINMELGAYDLDFGKTIYYSNRDLDDDMDLLKACCSLPLASKVVSFKGRKLLDGGITQMIPIHRAIEKGCTKFLVITTKPSDYVRKKSPGIVVFLMKLFYPNCPSISRDYAVRQQNYYEQINTVKELQEAGKALLICPSETISVNRFKGDPEKCRVLFDLGYRDMENRKQTILCFLKGSDK